MKKIVSILLILLLSTGMVACSDHHEDVSGSNSSGTLETSSQEGKEEETEVPEEEPEPRAISLGELITKDGSYEFSIDEADWVYELSARLSSNSTLSIAEASSGNVLFYFKINYKNLSADAFDSRNYSVGWEFNLKYDNQYTYPSQIPHDTFPANRLDPLMSGDIYVVFELPETFKTDNKEISVEIQMDNDYYTLPVRSGSDVQTDPVDTLLNVNELHTIDGRGEITLVDTYTTDLLEPKHPGSWHSYFEAPEGYHYVIGEFKVKNLSNDSIHTSDVIKGHMVIGDHSVEGFCVLSSTDYSDIATNYSFEALAEHTAYFVAGIPDDLAGTPGTMEIMFANEKFEVPFNG